MYQTFKLDKNYSTTRRVLKADSQEIAELIKQSNKSQDKLETKIFLHKGEGLRTQGYYKVGGIISAMDPPALKPYLSINVKPLITVVTVVMNGEKFLEETILSIINQTYDNVEYIIIDGGSSDGTLGIIRKYEQAIDYWISENDKGIYDAMNKGISLATGEWINFINADDYLASEDVIQKVIENLPHVSPSCSIVYGSLNLVKDSGESLYIIKTPAELAKRQLKTRMSVPHQSQFCRLSSLKMMGGYKRHYKISGDYEMTIRLLKHHELHYIDNLIVASMRIGGVSSSPENSLKVLYEDRLAQLENGLRITIPFIAARFRVYIRFALWKLFGESFTRKLLDFANKLFGRKTFWVKTRK
jgi:glycosyltransferase involved in cell wall biosynthesis